MPRAGQHHTPEAIRRMSEASTKYHFSADELRRLYWEKNLTLAKISIILGANTTTIYRWFVKYSIPRKRSRDYPRWNKGLRKRTPKICPVCGKLFYVKPSYALRIKRPHCSNNCKYADPTLNKQRGSSQRKMLLSKEELERLHSVKSASQIGAEYGLSAATVLKWLRKYGVPVKPLGYWLKGKPIPMRTRIKISRGMKGKKKNLSGETRRRLSEIRRGKIPWNKGKPFLRGPLHPLYGKRPSEETRRKIKDKRKLQQIPTSKTKPELRFMEICEKYNLPFKYTGDSSFWIGCINPDFIGTNGKKIAVDVFGDYWHDPSSRDVPWYGQEANRIAIAKREGWNLVVIWESELENEELVLEKLQRILDGQA